MYQLVQMIVSFGALVCILSSINTVRSIIEDKEFIQVIKKGKIKSVFLKWNKFEPFSYEFLNNKDLTFTEKAYLTIHV